MQQGAVIAGGEVASTPRKSNGSAESLKGALRALVGRGYLVFVFGAVVAVGAASSPVFLSSRNWLNILITGSIFAILAVSEFLIIVTAGIDLSLGSTVALSSVVAALLMANGWGAVPASLVALMAGAAVGALNGFGVVVLGVTPFIVTLASLGIAAGIAYVIQVGTLVTISNPVFASIFNGKIGWVSVEVVYFVVIALVAGWAMRHTVFGRRLYAIGGNAEAARLTGLPVKRDVFLAYVIAAVLAAFAGLLLAAELGEGSASLGQNYELDAIAAAVVGGASLFGGKGDPISAVVGGLVLGMIENIMTLRGIAAEPQLIVRGVVILVAVALISRGSGIKELLTRRQAARPRVEAAATPAQQE
jgi:ribose transport system permease protein